MKKIKFTIVLSLFFIFFTFIFLNETVKSENVTTKHGLSHNNILTIYQDSIGYIWIGTQNGLNRYDGYNFKIYKNDKNNKKSISGNVITTIYEDSDGYIWVGTEGGGLNKFDRKTESFKRFPYGSGRKNISHSVIKSIIEDSDGNIWIGTYGGGVDKYNKVSKKFTRYKHNTIDKNSISGNIINVIYKDSNDNIWIGTEGKGLNKYLEEQDAFKRYPSSNNIPKSTKSSKLLSGKTVNTIFEDSKGNLWIGTWGGGLNKLNRQRDKFSYIRKGEKRLSSNIIRAIDEDKNGNLWLGTWNGGALKYNPNQDTFTHYKHNPNKKDGLKSNIVWSVFVDRAGIVWLGTWGGGIHKYVWRDNIFKHYQHLQTEKSLSDDKVTCFYEDKEGYIWIGTLGGGLNRFNRQTDEFIHFKNDSTDEESLPNNIIRTVYQDSKGRIWVGTDGGLALYLKDKNKFKTYKNIPGTADSLSDNRVYAIDEDKFGDLWIGTWSGGLNKFDFEKEEFVRYNVTNSGLSSNNIWEIYADKNGNLWAGTTYGLNLFNRETNDFSRFVNNPNNKDSLSANPVSDIFEDSTGNLWVGTLEGGLNLLNRNNMEFENFTVSDGFVSNSINGILEDNSNNLWLSSNKGLMRFDPEDMSIDSYDISDGLQGNDFTMGANLKSKNGELYFGGINGFNVFDPTNVKRNNYKPPVVLTSLKQDGEKMELEQNINTIDKLTLSWENNSFEFEFAGLNFIQSNENKYAYMLEGFEKEWNYIDHRRFGRYTNIPDGNYILKIKAANNDGIWTDKILKIKLKVIPPFWRKTWFRVCLIIVAILLIYLIYWIKLITIKRRNQKLEKAVQKRSKEIIDKNKELKKMKKNIEENNEKLKDALKKVEEISKTDTLTNLPNRRHMLEKISDEISRHKRNNKTFSLIISDIDHFKEFNDTYGHDIGDLVLKKVSSVIKESKRQEDFAARWGGEEFLIILPETNSNEAYTVSERIRKAIMNMKCKTDNQVLQVTMTFGLAEYDLTCRVEQNIDKADQALYVGKEGRRNCSIAFEDLDNLEE